MSFTELVTKLVRGGSPDTGVTGTDLSGEKRALDSNDQLAQDLLTSIKSQQSAGGEQDLNLKDITTDLAGITKILKDIETHLSILTGERL